MAHLSRTRFPIALMNGKTTLTDDDAKREAIRSLLASGLATETEPRADDDAMFRVILDRLRASDRELKTKLVIGGFTLEMVEHGGFEQACESCMYCQVHRRWCELPELDLPVEPEWSCRLWRI